MVYTLLVWVIYLKVFWMKNYNKKIKKIKNQQQSQTLLKVNKGFLLLYDTLCITTAFVLYMNTMSVLLGLVPGLDRTSGVALG